MKRSLVILCLLASRAFAAPELTMQDLQALEKQQAWTELLENADRVKPSARTADWSRLVTSAATRVVEKVEKDTSSDWAAIRELVAVVPVAEHKYASLKTDKGYLAVKAKALARVVAMCTREKLSCGSFVDQLAEGIDKFPKGIALEIALMLSDEKTASETIRYWALAVDDDKDLCSHGRLERAVLAVLRSPVAGKLLRDAQRTAGTCYAVLETALVKELIDTKDKQPFIANACPVLKTHGTKTVVKTKKCP